MFGIGSFIEKVVSSEDCSEVQCYFSILYLNVFNKGKLQFTIQILVQKKLLTLNFYCNLSLFCPINIWMDEVRLVWTKTLKQYKVLVGHTSEHFGLSTRF